MSDKLVYVDSVKKRLNEAYGEGNLLGLDGILSEVPTVDAVEVVRCWDCKHFTEGKAIGKCYLNPYKPIIHVPYKHFCSFGVRRSENV